MSLAWIVTGSTSPAYVLSVGVNTAVALPSTTLSVYVPITSPAGFLAGTDSAGCPFSSNSVNDLGSSGTSFSTPLTVAVQHLVRLLFQLVLQLVLHLRYVECILCLL